MTDFRISGSGVPGARAGSVPSGDTPTTKLHFQWDPGHQGGCENRFGTSAQDIWTHPTPWGYLLVGGQSDPCCTIFGNFGHPWVGRGDSCPWVPTLDPPMVGFSAPTDPSDGSGVCYGHFSPEMLPQTHQLPPGGPGPFTPTSCRFRHFWVILGMLGLGQGAMGVEMGLPSRDKPGLRAPNCLTPTLEGVGVSPNGVGEQCHHTPAGAPTCTKPSVLVKNAHFAPVGHWGTLGPLQPCKNCKKQHFGGHNSPKLCSGTPK